MCGAQAGRAFHFTDGQAEQLKLIKLTAKSKSVHLCRALQL